MSDGPSSQRRTKEWPKPESGGKPKRITTKNEPGGPKTPGAKAKKQPNLMGKPVGKPSKDFNPKDMSPEQRKNVDDEMKRRGWKK